MKREDNQNVWDNLWEGKNVSFLQELKGKRNYSKNQYMKEFLEKIKLDPHYKFIEKELTVSKNAIFLEAGCGTGHWVFYAKEKGNRAFGIDISTEALKIAKTHEKSDSQFICGDVKKLPIAQGSFDIIVSLGVIEHIDRPDKIINEFYRVLKKGGKCFITVPNALSTHPITSLLSKMIGKWDLGREDIYSQRRLKTLMGSAGFEDVKTGIVPTGHMLGSFPLYIPLIGRKIFNFLYRISYMIECKQSKLGFFCFAIGEKMKH
ncbi:MAG: class I SAM-dependent methyltransferase [Candidatus Aenigmarchaeota archaeon]|nr:class I SAM-dependent methyltransferase [Candidatus Aenigmarchaeota archaeon]